MTSIIGKVTILALAILCLLPLALTENCRAENEGQTDGNDSVQEQTTAESLTEAPIILNDDTLDEAIKNHPYLVVDCWETDCPPCKLIEPKIDSMAKEFRGRIVFAKLCIDRNPIALSRYRISRTPTLLVFKSGKIEAEQVGNYPQEDLERMILAVLHLK
jgi:thioredoxin-like negative regulator of GroEL